MTSSDDTAMSRRKWPSKYSAEKQLIDNNVNDRARPCFYDADIAASSRNKNQQHRSDSMLSSAHLALLGGDTSFTSAASTQSTPMLASFNNNNPANGRYMNGKMQNGGGGQMMPSPPQRKGKQKYEFGSEISWHTVFRNESARAFCVQKSILKRLSFPFRHASSTS